MVNVIYYNAKHEQPWDLQSHRLQMPAEETNKHDWKRVKVWAVQTVRCHPLCQRLLQSLCLSSFIDCDTAAIAASRRFGGNGFDRCVAFFSLLHVVSTSIRNTMLTHGTRSLTHHYKSHFSDGVWWSSAVLQRCPGLRIVLQFVWCKCHIIMILIAFQWKWTLWCKKWYFPLILNHITQLQYDF